MQDRDTSEYAAIHLFDLLVAAGRKDDLRTCLSDVESTKVIQDPIKRRQVDLARLRAALHVTSEAGDNIETAKTIIIGAESLRTADKVEWVMRDNPDLSAAFVPDTIEPLILNDPKHRSFQGPLLMHLGAERARKNDRFRTREALRAVNTWLDVLFHSQDAGSDWRFEDKDITASVYARAT